jgi:hypothetical protein
MEQKQDYIETQISLVSRMLRKLLEKLLNIKAGEDEELQHIVQAEITSDKEGLLIDTLSSIEDTQLVETLTGKYGYSNDELKVLADILYHLSGKITGGTAFKKKALILYRYYLSAAQKNIDLLVYNRVNELANGLK